MRIPPFELLLQKRSIDQGVELLAYPIPQSIIEQVEQNRPVRLPPWHRLLEDICFLASELDRACRPQYACSGRAGNADLDRGQNAGVDQGGNAEEHGCGTTLS